ncbi:glucan endo-1,3-beta-glucosidase 7-like [Musa acuminata AAA Group]|uniref:glucan endo-1,3-beta-glucosidase 7-like n=1 Tax=Musa acuminata AAA Group TaxID=214697 RepID=UPI0031E0CE2D
MPAKRSDLFLLPVLLRFHLGMEKWRRLLLVLVLFLAFFSARSQSFIGVNYGQVADNLPPPSATASLLQSTTISKLRLYGADPAIIRSLSGTNISLVLGVPNADIPSLASDPSAAASWAAANVLPYVPATSISLVAVGNEALDSGDAALASQLLPAMRNLGSAVAASGVKVSTVHTMSVLAHSEPPSSGAFRPELSADLTGILGFLRDTGSPFMINPYPFFAYRSDPRPETLAFCLFQPNPGRFDAGSKLMYTNMFDAQVDAVRSALDGLGFPGVEIVVAETGWPYRGDPDEVGTTVENARAFTGNLVAHLRSLVGTPLMPGRSVDTYIFALYDEDLKPGPASERFFGLYRADQTMNYDAGLVKSASSSYTSPSPPAATTGSTPPAATTGRCVPGATPHTSADGRPTQPEEQCHSPDAVGSRAAVRADRLFVLSVALTLLL